MYLRKWMINLALISAVGLVGPHVMAQERIWGVTQNQFLVAWNSNSPSNLIFGTAISGLQQNEQIVGIDFRPADETLYAIGSSNRLYSIDMNGSASQIGSAFNIPLDGSAFGYDFNPTIDRSRVDTNTNNNYVVNPNDGSIVQVNDLFFQTGDPNFGFDPNVSHIAYTNSFAGATNTQLYAIDTGLDLLATQANSAGTLNTIGSLGFDITEIGGFDISGNTDLAYGAFQFTYSSNSQFFSVNLSNGQLSWIGEIGGGTIITAMTVEAANSAAVPEPGSAFALLAFIPAFAFRRKR